jgi:hypothetical protein
MINTAHAPRIARKTRTPAAKSRGEAESPALKESPIATSFARYRRDAACTRAALCAASKRIATTTATRTKPMMPTAAPAICSGLGVVACLTNAARAPAKIATASTTNTRTRRRYQIAERPMKTSGFDR